MRAGSASTESVVAGDTLPERCHIIEVRVAELRQLFNAIDPSPFHACDLDPRAEEFIVGWASDLPMNQPWALVVHLDRAAGKVDESALLRDAIHEYFDQRVGASRRRLRELFHRGRISLRIALAFLTASIAIGDAVADYLGESRLGDVIREGFLIGGWVIEFAGEPIDVLTIPWIAAPGSFEQTTQSLEIVFGDEDVAHSHVQLRSPAGPPRIGQAPGDNAVSDFRQSGISARS